MRRGPAFSVLRRLTREGVFRPAADTVHTFMAGLGGLAADGLRTTAFADDVAAARLQAANEHITATLGL